MLLPLSPPKCPMEFYYILCLVAVVAAPIVGNAVGRQNKTDNFLLAGLSQISFSVDSGDAANAIACQQSHGDDLPQENCELDERSDVVRGSTTPTVQSERLHTSNTPRLTKRRTIDQKKKNDDADPSVTP